MRTISAEGPDATEVAVILGVDTHLDFHVAVAVDHLGRRLGEASVPTTAKGYEELLRRRACCSSGFDRRGLGRAKERRWVRGDDQGPTRGPPFGC